VEKEWERSASECKSFEAIGTTPRMQMELMTNRANCVRVIQMGELSKQFSARVDSGRTLSELPRRLKMQQSGMWMINLCGKMKISIRLEENRDDSTTVLKDGDLQVLKKCNGWIDAYSSTTTLACEKMELGMRIEFKYCEKTMEREGLCNACESKLSGQSWNGSNASCDDKRICHEDG